MCHREAEYQLGNGLALCGLCTQKYLERLASNVNLPGEDCQWERAHREAYNLFDGNHDWLPDVNRAGASCEHKDCSRKRRLAAEAQEADSASA
ncbi:MAG: hypothetical protein Unbinned5784contig1000_4 [Prokaryotic dsDNA virus sp.]|nr:MAG: hypothetical protein Unbinned5784contig1000_4 [Prokaryotic dsDNA virus sp.]